ncbi:MAG: MBL fold metallo-hydrolase [Burkholderiaceae bacterium]
MPVHHAKPHHVGKGFRNPYGSTGKDWRDFLRWQAERRGQVIPAPQADLSVVEPELDFIGSGHSRLAATWIGHSTVLVQIAGMNILTDPVFSDRASLVPWSGPRRWQAPGLALDQLPHIDLVLLSHNHYDHLDAASVKALARQAGGAPLFAVPLGVEAWMAAAGIKRVQALDWWDELMVGEVKLTFVPAQHWSGRTALDRNRTLWGGFVVEAVGRSVYFAGDTGYSPEFERIGRRFGEIDLALIPIGSYLPRWFMAPQHVDPSEAVKIHRDVRARRSIGIHWGTFQLADDALDAAPLELAAARQAAGLSPRSFITLRHGQTLKL